MYLPKKFSWPKPPKEAFPYIKKLRENIPVKKYLTMPFKEQKYKITEGWFYSKDENKIHGLWGHAGIDFELPRGSDIFASASGWAMSSYMRRPFFNEDGSPRKYKDKTVQMGLGYFVQIYHPKYKRYTLYAHLGKIAEKIPYSPAKRLKNGKIVPSNLTINPGAMTRHLRFVWINRGEKIGEIGDSGICWGFDDYPKRPDYKKYPSWDDIHLHFEEFSRDLKDGSRSAPRDPYDIYWLADKYPDSYRNKNINYLGEKTIWKLKNGHPKFVV